MNIRVLFLCRSFYPCIGGMEQVAELLAERLSASGVAVRLITLTPLNGLAEVEGNYRVIRNPSPGEWWSAIKWCTIFFHHSLSLKGIWPLFFFRRKWVVLHHILYAADSPAGRVLSQIKRCCTRFAENIPCSEWVRLELNLQKTRMVNPYNDRIFYINDRIARSHDLIFAGRLVSTKGCHLVIHALKLLRDQYHIFPSLTIAGDGPCRKQLEELAVWHGLTDRVHFTGILSSVQLATAFNCHKIIVVPSAAAEPFGMVVLEGLACGCIPLVSHSPGLREAGMGFGMAFKNGSIPDLAAKLAQMLRSVSSYTPGESSLKASLSRHTAGNVTKEYLELFCRLQSAVDEEI